MRTKRFWPLLTLGSVLFLFSCKKSDTGDDNTGTPTTTFNKTLMLQLVNEQRLQGCNCGTAYYGPTTPVVWNDQLEAAAAAHVLDMYQNNYFSHTGRNGSTPGQRITASGYTWTAYGENIAKGFTTERDVMEAWVNSPEHCVNIMNPAFKEMGAARANTYWGQEFGSRF